MNPRTLRRRLDKITPRKPAADYEANAHTMWVLIHLTNTEERQLVDILVRLQAGASSEQGLDQLHASASSILMKGEERANKEPPETWGEYKAKWTRRETLRMLGRRPTDRETAEKQRLMRWFDEVNTRLEKNLNGSYEGTSPQKS